MAGSITEPLTALVVDPDEEERALIVAALAAHGFRVAGECAEDASGEALDEADPHLLLLAASSIRDGLLERLGSGPVGVRWPIVLVMADRRSLRTQRSQLAEAADQIIVRPLTPDTLDTWLMIGRRRVEERADALEREERLRQCEGHRAANDALTGLPNRASLLSQVQAVLELRGRGGRDGYAVLHVNLDHFRNVNYGLGYVTADRLLPLVAGRLQAATVEAGMGSAVVAYLGADEFGILLRPVAEQADAARFARMLLERLATPYHVATHDLLLTASIGVAMGDPSYARAEEILRDADAAMMRAKALGGASYTSFAPELDRGAMAELRLEEALRRALQGNELRLVYQPIVRLDTEEIAGLEALVRWRDSSGNDIAPDQFIPVAERTGLIVVLDRWAVRQACRQIRAWQGQLHRQLPFPVSVNVSGVQFLRPDFVVEVDRELRTHGLYGTSLRIEITESALMTRGRQASDMLRQLLALRVALSIDDFGTGYSSLAYLHELEADTLKIDRSFVSRMHRDSGGMEIVRAIIRLAQSLSKRVVAEGVELRSQADELRQLGCQLAQGNYFFPPQPPDKVSELLAESLGERGVPSA